MFLANKERPLPAIREHKVGCVKWITDQTQRQESKPVMIGMLFDEGEKEVELATVCFAHGVTMEVPPLGLGIFMRSMIAWQADWDSRVRGAQHVRRTTRKDHARKKWQESGATQHSIR
jgi:hypothetical protein